MQVKHIFFVYIEHSYIKNVKILIRDKGKKHIKNFSFKKKVKVKK